MTVVPQKGPTTSNTHMKYESSITYDSKVMANVKFCCERCDHDTVILTLMDGLDLIPQGIHR